VLGLSQVLTARAQVKNKRLAEGVEDHLNLVFDEGLLLSGAVGALTDIQLQEYATQSLPGVFLSPV
jgi:hypothetical protein